MNSQQYEELCRYFLANNLGMSLNDIKSVNIPNPTRPGLPKYKHQIDLYWETESNMALYLHIADAKWRGDTKVDQPEVMLLQQVKEKVAAHKAMMLTNLGYTAGAVAVAKDEGIALHIVRPDFPIGLLPKRDSVMIQGKLNEIANSSATPIFLHEIVHKAFDFREGASQAQVSSPLSGPSGIQTKIISSSETKVGGGYTHKAGTESASQGGVKASSGAPITKSGGPIKTK
jgi:hypothetical protein